MTAVSEARRQLHWQTLTSPGAHAAAVTVTRGERVRVVVCESTSHIDASGACLPELQRLLHRGSPAQIAAACRDDGASVCVAELLSDGTATVSGFAAPSALLVGPGGRRLVPPAPAGAPAGELRLHAGELLVLCSPSVLEDPPQGMLEPRSGGSTAFGDDPWEWALAGLVGARSHGAVAVVQLRAS